MIEILVADDHPVVRWGLKQMFENYPDLHIAGEAATSDALIEQVRRRSWNLVILDLALPPGGGMEALKTIRDIAPQLPVLILSIYPEEDLAIRMLRLGANGYITKGAEADVLVPAIRKVAKGEKYVSAAVSEQLLASMGPKGVGHAQDALTARELQVLRLLGQGRTITEIAKELKLSVKTVSTYRSRLLEKLQVRTTGELIRYAISEKIVE